MSRVNWETSRNQSFEIQGNTATMQRLTLNLTVHEERLHYVYVYSALMIGMVYVVAQKSATFFSACLRASQNIHNKLFDGIIHAKMYFFHTNASGRIINRFSQDIMSIDALLPIALYDTVLVSDSNVEFFVFNASTKPFFSRITAIKSDI